MGYHYRGTARAYREGWTGRRRTYKCRKCHIKYQHDGHKVPPKARICPKCCQDPECEADRLAAYEAAERRINDQGQV